MSEFTITEDFHCNPVEFDQRFSDVQACYEHLFQLGWPECFVCRRCGHKTY